MSVKKKENEKILEDGEIEEDDNFGKNTGIGVSSIESEMIDCNCKGAAALGKKDFWKPRRSRSHRRRRRIENQNSKDKNIRSNKRKCEIVSYGNDSAVAFKKKRSKKNYKRKKCGLNTSTRRFFGSSQHHKQDGIPPQIEDDERLFSQKRKNQPQRLALGCDFDSSHSNTDSIFSHNSPSQEDSFSSGSESYYSELELHLKKSHGTYLNDDERSKNNDRMSAKEPEIKTFQRTRQKCFHDRSRSPGRGPCNYIVEERLTEINRKHREPEKMFDKYDHFRPINRHREFQPYEERFHYIHPLRQDLPRRALPLFDMRPNFRPPPEVEFERRRSNMIREMIGPHRPLEGMGPRDHPHPNAPIPFNNPRLTERHGSVHPIHDFHPVRPLDAPNQLKENDCEKTRAKAIIPTRLELPDKNPPKHSLAPSLPPPSHFTMPIAPPLFTPNNLNGGILAIGAGRLMHPMTMTCLPPPPPSGLLCPLPRPPLMMPPLPMQGILPGMLSPAAAKSMLPPWIQQQNIQRQPNQKISNALGLHGTCTSSENPAKLSEQNTENDPAISAILKEFTKLTESKKEAEIDSKMKETANDNAVIVLDDPDVIGLDNPNVIQVTAERRHQENANATTSNTCSMNRSSNEVILKAETLQLNNGNMMQFIDKERSPSEKKQLPVSSSDVVQSIMQMAARRNSTSTVDANLLSKVADVISFSPLDTSSLTKDNNQNHDVNFSFLSDQSHPKKQKENRNESNSIRLILKRKVSLSELRKEPCNIPLITTKPCNPKNPISDPRNVESRLLNKKKKVFLAPIPSFGNKLAFRSLNKVLTNVKGRPNREDTNKPTDPRVVRGESKNNSKNSRPKNKTDEFIFSLIKMPSKESTTFQNYPPPPPKPMALLRMPSTSLSALSEINLELQNTEINLSPTGPNSTIHEGEKKTQDFQKAENTRFDNLPLLVKANSSTSKTVKAKDEKTLNDFSSTVVCHKESTADYPLTTFEAASGEKSPQEVAVVSGQGLTYSSSGLPRLTPAPSYLTKLKETFSKMNTDERHH